MEGQYVAVGRIVEAVPQPVNDRVRGLVRDNVLGQAGEDGLARQVGPRILGVGGEVAELERKRVRVVEGVLALKSMRKNRQFLAAAEVDRPPSARSKFSITFIATAYTICWWNRGSESDGSRPRWMSTSAASRSTGA
jgi:hypothetical protein